MVEKVHEYIRQLAVNESHYSRESTPHRRYLVEYGMYTTHLHTNYVEWLKNKYPIISATSPWKFRDIYTKCYNILPRPVKTDTCDTCERLTTEIGLASTPATAGRKDDLQKVLEEHLANARTQVAMLERAETIGPTQHEDSGWRTICTGKLRIQFFWV